MKKSKKILSALLAALLVLQVFVVSMVAQAATTKSPYDSKTYTHYLNLDSSKILNGIDVSYHNGTINWQKVKADGVQFVFLRIGYRGWGSSGSLNKDTLFDTYYNGAKAAGIKIGIYFYSQALNESEANAEANYSLELLKGRALDLPIVFDYEFAGVQQGRLDSANLSKRQMTNNVHAFCETVEEAGYSSMLYANKTFLNDHLYADEVAAHYPIWIARYDATKLDFTKGVSAWQYTSSGTVSGISGNTDANFLYDGLTLTRIRGIEPEYEYTGKAIQPKITLEYLGTTLKEGVDYSTPVFTNNTKLGTATVTINGLGKFAGTTRTATFNIVQPGTAETPLKEVGEVTTDTLNVRTGPSTDYSIVTTISRGTRVNIHSVTNGWYNVTFAKGSTNYNGYVSSAYIEIVDTGYEVEPSDTRVQIMADSVPVKSSASNGGATVINLSLNNQVYVNGESGSWYKVSFTKDSLPYAGYIEKKFAKVLQGTAKPKGIVVANSANVYTNTDETDIECTLSRNLYVYLDGETDDYYIVSFSLGGWHYGYIRKDYVRDNTLPRDYTSTWSARQAQVMTDEAVVRDAADANSEPVSVLYNGNKIYINGEDGAWYKVSFSQNGEPYNGYVEKKYFRITAGEAKPKGIVVAASANVYSDTNESRIESTLSRDLYVYVDDTTGDYYQVSFSLNGWHYGYIRKDYVRDNSLPRNYTSTWSARQAQVMTEEVVVRDAADTESAPVTILKESNKIYINGETNEWYMVSFSLNGKPYNGYAEKKYFRITSGEAKQKGIVVAASANVYTDPDESNVDTTLSRDQYAYIDGKYGDYYVVSFSLGGWHYGYIRKDYLRDDSLPRNYTVTSSSQLGTVTKAEIIVRETTDADSAPVTVLTKNNKVYINGEEGDWYKVSFTLSEAPYDGYVLKTDVSI